MVGCLGGLFSFAVTDCLLYDFAMCVMTCGFLGVLGVFCYLLRVEVFNCRGCVGNVTGLLVIIKPCTN